MSIPTSIKSYFAALLLTGLMFQHTTAQNMVVGSGPKVTVNGGMTMDIPGNLTVEASGEMENAGEVTVGGNLSNSGSLTITSTAETSSGSMIVTGTSTGSIIFERYITGKKFHALGAPFAGQTINGFLTTVANDISTLAGEYAMTSYDEATDNWNSYFTTATAGNLVVGSGYLVGRENDGLVAVTGTFDPTGVDVSITRDGRGWNLLANPFPSAIGVTAEAASTANFLTVNAASLDENYAGLYLWDHDNTRYLIINNAAASNPSATLVQDYLQAGQGFFVRSQAGGATISFTANMAIHQPDATLLKKSSSRSWPTINLFAGSGDAQSTTCITFNEKMTRGLDVTYDAGMNKSNPQFALYSRLVEDNGTDFTIQCLPEEQEMVIPLGLDAVSGQEVSITAQLDNWFENSTVKLEDRSQGTFTELDQGDATYAFVTNTSNTGPGNFYLHINLAPVTSRSPETMRENYTVMPDRQAGTIRILGRTAPGTVVRIVNMSGQVELQEELVHGYENLLDAHGLEQGFYLVQVRDGQHIQTKKIAWL